MTKWVSVLELDSHREVTAGSPNALCAAIRRGADLRIYTEFIHNQHIDPTSASDELHPRGLGISSHLPGGGPLVRRHHDAAPADQPAR